MSEFVSWEFLATFAGAVAITGVFTQFIKKIVWLQNIDTQWISAILGIIIVNLAAMATAVGAVGVFDIIMNIINGIIVGLAANGAYDALSKVTTFK